jgi:hypothetical protein
MKYKKKKNNNECNKLNISLKDISEGYFLVEGNQVNPEYLSLKNVPFLFCLGLRYSNYGYKNPNTTKYRNHLLENILDHLNSHIKDVVEQFYRGKNTVRAILISEYDTVQPELHGHLLFHINPEVATELASFVWDWLENFVMNPHKGIADCYLQTIYDLQGMVSYVCKVRRSPEQDHHKEFLFSKGFKRIILTFHSAPEFLFQGRMVSIASDNDPYLPLRIKKEVRPLIKDKNPENLIPASSIPHRDENIVEKLERITKESLGFNQKDSPTSFPAGCCSSDRNPEALLTGAASQ